ncbi:unnamed protein product [Phytophthora fragariaefolia]|uniref:Unnamed protein product n=1 Tax=Phytophthora fragariaefolia TaxID=1490495 RepID=A0A9W6XIK2_9STRA|nr:unnamed protein product [Phytophthora fragariaefolia]
MPTQQRHKEWRQRVQNSASRPDASPPTDTTFQKAEAAFLDPETTAADKRAAALAGVPQLVDPDLLIPMWIPARDLTSSFSNTEIMTSFGSTHQDAVWNNSLSHLQAFKAVKNAGILFMCTDQQRLPDDVTDDIIYAWFADQGTPPVLLTPTHVVNGLRSRGRKVYFNQKSPPKSVMLTGKPLRQIKFSERVYTIVHHRVASCNRVSPLSSWSSGLPPKWPKTPKLKKFAKVKKNKLIIDLSEVGSFRPENSEGTTQVDPPVSALDFF